MNKPNILLIFTDQQRFDTLNAYGNSVIQTPNIDAIAKNGAVFENAITPSPVCVPARASLVSGYAAGKISLDNSGSTLDRTDTIATRLKEKGYHCQAVGKMHFIPFGETYGMSDMVLSEEMRGVRWANKADEVKYDDYDKFLIKNKLWGWEKPTEIGYNEIKPLVNPLPKEYHVTQWCGDRTVDWIKNHRPKDKPFFLWSSFIKPHVPYDCPIHLKDLYDPDEIPDPLTRDEKSGEENPVYRERRETMEFDLYSQKAVKQSRAYYYANMTFIDEQVGRIIHCLEEEGLTKNTIVIFTSDHGDMLGDYGQWYKRLGYEGSVHIPLLVSWPGKIMPGTRVDSVVNLTDIYPTLCNLAGIEFTGDRPGKDLLSFLSKENNISRELSFSEFGKPPQYRLTVRHKDYTYLWYQGGGFEELYDLRKDPFQSHNVAEDKNYKSIKQDLTDAAITWIKKYSNSNIALDGNGNLRKEPYDSKALPENIWKDSPSRFSKLPWELRIPASRVPNGDKSWWWKAVGGDLSKLVQYGLEAINRKSK